MDRLRALALLMVIPGCGGSNAATGATDPAAHPGDVPAPKNLGTLPHYDQGCSAGNRITATADRQEVNASEQAARINVEIEVLRPGCFGLRGLYAKVLGGRMIDDGSAYPVYVLDDGKSTHLITINSDWRGPGYGSHVQWREVCSAGATEVPLTLHLYADIDPPVTPVDLAIVAHCDR